MLNKNIKIKYLAEAFAFAFMFFVAALPVFAGEINSQNILQYVNQSREEVGSMELVSNEVLTKIAEDKLKDMISNKYFAHTSPAGVTPWHWFEKNKYDYRYAGENLAISFLTVENQHKAWMESPTHKKNILNPDYQEIGIAVGAGEIDGQVSIIAVQEFGTQMGALAPKSEKNFSTGKNTNLIKNEGQIIPQVLSVKKEANLQMTMPNDISHEKNTRILEMADVLTFTILLFSLALSPLVFVSIAVEKIIFIRKSKLIERSAGAMI